MFALCSRPAAGCSTASRAMRIIFVLLVGLVRTSTVGAFAVKDVSVSRATDSFPIETALFAWRLPNPSHSPGFSQSKGTWYDVHNPTARQTVYNE